MQDPDLFFAIFPSDAMSAPFMYRLLILGPKVAGTDFSRLVLADLDIEECKM